jgi:hypothetical protein
MVREPALRASSCRDHVEVEVATHLALVDELPR